MFELLKKIGIPATVALVVVSLFTFVPLFFGVDSRYAKHDHTQAELEKISRQIQDLATEVNKIAGAQETLLIILSSQVRSAPIERLDDVRPAPPRTFAPPPPAPATSTGPVTSVPPPPAVAVRPAPVAPAPKPEVAKQLEQLRDATRESQKRIQEIQKY